MAWGDDSEYGRWQLTDISPSKLATFDRCYRQFWYRYVDPRKLPTFMGPWLPMGSAIHEIALEEFLAGGIQDTEALTDLCVADFILRCELEDIREKGEPITQASVMVHADLFRVWVYGLLETLRTGKDPYGEDFVLPPIAETEVEVCYPLQLKGGEIRIRGMIDMVFEDGSVGDLKMASDWNRVIWKIGKVFSEVQPMAYTLGMDTDIFRYTIVDKRKSRGQPLAPRVRNIEYKVDDTHYDNFKQLLERFVRTVDLFGRYENGIFPATPSYKGETFKSDVDRPEETFCGHLCDYKEHCFNESFNGEKICGG